MSELMDAAAAVGAGIMLGAIFFGGLWWTVRRGISSSRGGFWFLGSLLIRTGIVLLGFRYFLGDDWKRMLLGLSGFVIARLMVTQLTKATEKPAQPPMEGRHAP